jgi:hypothetical protein
MFTSIKMVETDTDEQVPKSSPPWVWIGFFFAAAFWVVAVGLLLLGWDEESLGLPLAPILIGAFIYWLFCVHRIHKILSELTGHRYPISPGEAAAKHIIPFYNLFWMFKWSVEFSDYLNSKGRVGIISGYAIGAMLLLSVVLRFFDGAVGLAVLFGVTMYVSAKLKKHVRAMKTVSPDQLPPLPDPKIFSRPTETSTTPAPGIAEGP